MAWDARLNFQFSGIKRLNSQAAILWFLYSFKKDHAHKGDPQKVRF